MTAYEQILGAIPPGNGDGDGLKIGNVENADASLIEPFGGSRLSHTKAISRSNRSATI